MGARGLRIGLIVIACLLVLAVGGVAIFLAIFDPNDQKPRIVAAVKQATGRDLALNGPIRLRLSLQPTIEASDVAFSNPPGFSRPQMATLERLDLQLNLLPLLSRHIEIGRLVLVHPDIRLETDAQGRPNWQFAAGRTTTQAPAPNGSGTAATPSPTTEFTVRNVQIQDGAITYLDGASGRITQLAIRQLAVDARSADGPVHAVLDAAFNGTGFSLTADTGSLTRLQDQTATTPWPVKLVLTTGSARLNVDGALAQPLRGKGYDLGVTGTVPDLAALAPLVPGINLPPLHDVNFATKLADSGQPVPAVASLTVHVGPTDLAAQMPDLVLDRFDVDAPAANQPVKATATLRFGSTPVNLDATIGTLALLTRPATPPAPVPLNATLRAADATATLKGQIAGLATLSGVNLDATAQIPDLTGLSALAHRPLPPVKSIAFQAAITDAPGGLAKGIALRQIRLEMPGAALTGNVALGLGVPRSVVADLKGTRIDLDALLAASGAPSAAQPTAAPPSPPPPPRLPPPSARSERLFSDRPLPFDALRQANADLTLAIDDLHAGGADYKAIATHLVLQDGKLAIQPFAADLPTGRMEGTASADGSASTPPISLVLKAPGIPLRPLLTALGEPAYASGNLEVYADLHGAGLSPHAIAASLDGSLGVTLANGTIDNRLLGATLSKILEQIKLLDLVGRGGTSDLRCLAGRLDFQHGLGTLREFALGSSLLTMAGSGTVNLEAETLALQVRPQARVAGTGVVIPMRVTGPIRSPSVGVDSVGTAEANAGTVAGAVIGGATPLGLLGGVLGADKLTGGGSGDVCPGPLALARGHAAPEESGSRPATAGAAPKPKPSSPAGLLQQLFR